MIDSGSDARLDAEAQAWLVRLRAGNPGDQTAFEDWFIADPAHADAYERVLATWDAAGRLGQGHPAQRRGRSSRSIFMVVALAVLVIAGMAALSYAGLGQTPAEAITLSSRVGEIRTARLGDGTAVTLDTDTVIEATMSARERRVRLVRGRARFAVAPGTGRPLVIVAAPGSVSAADARLDIALIDMSMTVAVLGGYADIHPEHGAALRLDRGQNVAIGADPALAPQPVSAAATHWPSGMLTFENAPLAQVVREANRYNVTQISLVGGTVQALRFSGTFRPTDPSSLARMLAAAFHLRLTRDAAGTYLLSLPPQASPTPAK
ncbi:FecR family protein [Sphingomonas oligophenolica]|uniref:FecR domain-containing protein n=1 Tax=Sphingomonas oligophenolica TaxID=301154 RepID=A0ABU9Y3H9_9SPHN